MRNYSDTELRQLQETCLEMSKYFVDFCKQHQLLCYFCGGGCIGALRHKGFIPWDDDLDFFMPREDYNKLQALWEAHADTIRYPLQKPSATYNDRNSFITVRDANTTQVKPYQKDLDICHGVSIDIFPLDGYPESKWQRKWQVVCAYIYSLYCSQQVPKKHGKMMEFAGKLLLTIVPGKKAKARVWQWAERQMSKYSIADCDSITELCAGPGYMKKKYPKEAFADAVYKEFEGELMPIPVGYDAYLNEAFGDYMTLPPEEKRTSHHDSECLDLNKSYKEYKGIAYCVEK